MKRLTAAAAALALAPVPAAVAAEIDRTQFRYTRAVTAMRPGAVVIEPDGLLFAHTGEAFRDVRIVDARGRQVPWRVLPRHRETTRSVPLLNSGRHDRAAVALLDLGPARRVHDRLVLDVPERRFVGRAVVSGSDRRNGPFTRLAATGIYDVGGARNARSTTAVFPPTDFRYLQVRATGVSRIAGAAVSAARERPQLVHRPFELERVERGRRTILELDLRHRDLPVDELEISAGSPRYDRPVTIEGSNGGERFVVLARARISRFSGSRRAPIQLPARHRYLRIAIDNGDDEPLARLRVGARSRSRALVLEPGHRLPYRLLYGRAQARAPRYEFARLPLARDTRTVRGVLGPERANALFEPPPDTRSLAERHGWVVEAALALAAVAVGGVGLLALRRRA